MDPEAINEDACTPFQFETSEQYMMWAKHFSCLTKRQPKRFSPRPGLAEAKALGAASEEELRSRTLGAAEGDLAGNKE